jgi:hypothetical protein
MLNKLARKLNLRFHRKGVALFFLRLTNNIIQEYLWKLKKHLLNIKYPVVHLYAVCWNEEKFIPFFLQHYDDFVAHYYIYDNNSDDATIESLATKKNITIKEYNTDGTFNDVVNQQIKNNAWKHSRGKADWVIVIDIDELLYHTNIKELLYSSTHTIFKPMGYNMVCDKFPSYHSPITQQIKMGIHDKSFSKMVLFNPHKITEVNYKPGAHEANPEGIVNIGKSDDLKLLHYKNLGTDYVLNRIIVYRNRLSAINRKMLYGAQYDEENLEIIKRFNHILESSTKVI